MGLASTGFAAAHTGPQGRRSCSAVGNQTFVQPGRLCEIEVWDILQHTVWSGHATTDFNALLAALHH